MSVRETIWIFEQFDSNAYLDILKGEANAVPHPKQPEAYTIADQPFYEPLETEEFVLVVGFNHIPLPGVLIDVLAGHPELVADDTLIFWIIEQEILLETTAGELRKKKVEIDEEKREECRELAQTPFLLL